MSIIPRLSPPSVGSIADPFVTVSLWDGADYTIEGDAFAAARGDNVPAIAPVARAARSEDAPAESGDRIVPPA